jgi:hypothetical protein
MRKTFAPFVGEWIEIDPKFDGGPVGRDYYDEKSGVHRLVQPHLWPVINKFVFVRGNDRFF